MQRHKLLMFRNTTQLIFAAQQNRPPIRTFFVAQGVARHISRKFVVQQNKISVYNIHEKRCCVEVQNSSFYALVVGVTSKQGGLSTCATAQTINA